ncbi:SAM-dependent methyltransferase [Pseudonocardia eucalypti]|nr:SAM-dependent methyltransferase [Pseudonocardia eucalypti]
MFTELLATRCEELVAVDTSALAVRRARRRLAGHPHVRVRRSTLPEEMPGGRFDLVVCSEVLYYWNRELLQEALGALEEVLTPGGVLLAVHGRFDSHTCPLTGDEVHDLLHGRDTLRSAFSVREHKYRLDRFERPLRPPGHTARPAVPRQRTGRESTHPDAGSRTRGNSPA